LAKQDREAGRINQALYLATFGALIQQSFTIQSFSLFLLVQEPFVCR
jgi:hypothetical protein